METKTAASLNRRDFLAASATTAGAAAALAAVPGLACADSAIPTTDPDEDVQWIVSSNPSG